MGLFDAIDVTGSGLSAERLRMDVTSENLANADSTAASAGAEQCLHSLDLLVQLALLN